jgi:hypothetical protein
MGHDSSAWSPRQWQRSFYSGGVHIFGTRITLDSCHVYNAAGVYINFKAFNATVRNCVIENFPTDGMNIKASGATIEHNIIVGSHKVDGNHNDLCQAWDSSDVVFRANRLVAYVGPVGPLTARDVQGLGAYDGWKVRWIVTDNLVATDHPIGIWLQGDSNCVVGNNTVMRCGSGLFFSSQPTSILLGPNKSGAVKGGSRLFNNMAEAYRLTGAALASNTANAVIKPSAFASTFVDAPSDVHLKESAVVARGKGSFAALTTPSYDADFVQRVPGQPVDLGCLQYRASYAPVAPGPVVPALQVSVVPGLGYDVAWATATLSRSIEILKNGVRVAITRAAQSRFMVLDAGAAVTGTTTAPMPTFATRYVDDMAP